MTTDIRFSELRRLLLSLGFDEFTTKQEIVFRHKPSDTLFVFRPYRASDRVAEHNLLEVKSMLASEDFEDQFRRAPA